MVGCCESEKWWAVVKTVMNVRVPSSSRNVWASRGSTGFSGRVVLCAVLLGRQHTVTEHEATV